MRRQFNNHIVNNRFTGSFTSHDHVPRQFAAASGEQLATVDYVGTLSNSGVSLSEEQAVPFAAQFNSARNRLISGINSGEIATPKGSKN